MATETLQRRESEVNRVAVVRRDEFILKCLTCNCLFVPSIWPNRGLPLGHWICPNGCNAKTEPKAEPHVAPVATEQAGDDPAAKAEPIATQEAAEPEAGSAVQRAQAIAQEVAQDARRKRTSKAGNSRRSGARSRRQRH